MEGQGGQGRSHNEACVCLTVGHGGWGGRSGPVEGRRGGAILRDGWSLRVGGRRFWMEGVVGGQRGARGWRR